MGYRADVVKMEEQRKWMRKSGCIKYREKLKRQKKNECKEIEDINIKGNMETIYETKIKWLFEMG